MSGNQQFVTTFNDDDSESTKRQKIQNLMDGKKYQLSKNVTFQMEPVKKKQKTSSEDDDDFVLEDIKKQHLENYVDKHGIHRVWITCSAKSCPNHDGHKPKDALMELQEEKNLTFFWKETARKDGKPKYCGINSLADFVRLYANSYFDGQVEEMIPPNVPVRCVLDLEMCKKGHRWTPEEEKSFHSMPCFCYDCRYQAVRSLISNPRQLLEKKIVLCREKYKVERIDKESFIGHDITLVSMNWDLRTLQ